MRKLCTEELFTPRRLAELRAVREEKARELARAVSSSSEAKVRGGESGSPLLPVAVARAVFPAVAGAVVVAGTPNVSDYFPAVAAADVLGVRRRMEKLVAWTYGVNDRQIDLRRHGRAAGEPRRNDLLDAALDMEGQVDGTEGWVMNQEAMRGMFMDLLVAGSGSTTSTIEWAMAELLLHPRCMTKELRRVIGARPHVAESDISNLTYLQAVVKETLRLHPTVPIGLNKAEATVEVHGYRIPEGTTVYVNIWAICRRAKVWGDDAEERFVVGRDDGVGFLGNCFELIPFGAGRRICLGLPLAERMLHLMLGSLLHRFDCAVEDDGIDMAERFGLVLSMATPLRAVAKEVVSN
ncbi:cytochrome P450 76A1 [Sorghum bicolor]|uniref:cytochrome P450 76A1 n=1 Tax=Sorghum bicolor TaxID=4558 RepID=UPI000B424970|nr:cytochrome P450 76A1 [Sorghum bicolor]|eukprot:XP_021317855.1 cytochrome P450 76A1 [Sorghum bicolor]